MNEILKSKLEIIVNDDLLIQALKAVFDERIEQEKPQILEVENNEALGERYRAYEVAKILIEKSFVDLMSYKINRKESRKFKRER